MLVPRVMLERWADDLVAARRFHADNRRESADERIVKVVRELRDLADYAPRDAGRREVRKAREEPPFASCEQSYTQGYAAVE